MNVQPPAGPSDPSIDSEEAEMRERMLDRDWPNLGEFREANAKLLASGLPVDVVLMGDSLTEGWGKRDPDYFAQASVRILNRGISGQTSPQMLLRFMADVVALRPRAVHLMAGTNDVAGNTGRITFEDYRHNVQAMIALARTYGVRVILGTPLPAAGFPWSPEVTQVAPRLAEMREWLVAISAGSDLILADYYPVFSTPDGAMLDSFTRDGVHPTTEGYQQMRPVASAAFAAALA